MLPVDGLNEGSGLCLSIINGDLLPLQNIEGVRLYPCQHIHAIMVRFGRRQYSCQLVFVVRDSIYRHENGGKKDTPGRGSRAKVTASLASKYLASAEKYL